MKRIYYQIAEIDLIVEVPDNFEEDLCLSSFVSFKAVSLLNEETAIRVRLNNTNAPEVQGEKVLLSNISLVWADRFTFEESADAYICTIRSEDHQDKTWEMHASKDFSRSMIYVSEDAMYEEGVLSWMLMMLFGQVALSYQTVMIHASVIEVGEYGYAFLGKSGTGKSTHSRLWLKHIAGASLLNDDNPAIRVYDNGEVYIFGTPWSGKTPCYRNRKVELKGLVRLEQAKENSWQYFEGAQKMINLLPSCSAIRWNKVLFNQMLQISERIVERVPIGKLKNLPEQAAADLIYN